MQLNEYEDFVLGLMSPRSMETHEGQLMTAGFGLAGEMGEVVECLESMEKDKLILELGDLLFYMTFTSKVICDIGLTELIFDMGLNDYEYKFVDEVSTSEKLISSFASHTGKINDIFKKAELHTGEWTHEVRQKIIVELRKLMQFIVVCALDKCQLGLNDVIDANFKKLSARYKTKKFTVEEYKLKELVKDAE